MALSSAEATELENDTLTSEATEAVHEEAPASGQQVATEGAEVVEVPVEGVIEPTDEEKAAEKAKKEAEQPKGWKAVELAKKEQLRAAEARKAVETRVQIVQEHEAKLRAAEQQLIQQSRAVQQRAAVYGEWQQALKTGDIDTLVNKFGLDYEALTRRALENADPGTAAARKTAELEERLRKRDEADDARAAVAQTRREAQTLVEIAETADGVRDYPDLLAWPADRIANEGIAVRDAILRGGRVCNYDDVLRELQRRAKAESEAAVQKQQRLNQRTSQTRATGSAGQADQTGTSGSPGTAPVLTNKTAALRATPPRQKTEDEIDDECKAMLRGLKR